MQLFNQDPPILEFKFVPNDYIKVLEYSQAYESIQTHHYHDERRLVLSAVPNRERVFDTLKQQLFPGFKKLLEADTKFRYPTNIDYLCNNVALTFNVVKDCTQFQQGWHLDNRLVACAGIVNLQNNTVSTEFSLDSSGDNVYYTAPREKWTGAMWLNTENNWHQVPRVEQDRKIILFNFLLVSPHSSSSSS